MEQIDYSAMVPTKPDVDLVQWLVGQGAFDDEYLIYKAGSYYDPLEDRMKQAVEVVCTACEEKFYAQKVSASSTGHCYPTSPFGWIHPENGDLLTSGQDTLCPYCGHQAKAYHISNMSRCGISKEIWVTKVDRLAVNGEKDRLVVTDWMVERSIDRQGRKYWGIWPYTAYVVEDKKLVRLMGHTRYMSRVSLFGHWEQRKNYLDYTGHVAYLYPFDPSLPDGTTAENCRLDLYLAAGGTRLVSWLALWRKHPNAENLLVQGAGKLVTELLETEMRERSYTCYSGYGGCSLGVPRMADVNWKQRRPAQMLGLNKDEFRCLAAHGWGEDELDRYRLLRAAGVTMRLPEDMPRIKKINIYTLKEMLKQLTPADFWRVVRYLERQHSNWSTLWDYWSMAKEQGRDMDEGLVRWPRDLTAAHDRCNKERARIEAAKEAAENEERIRQRAAAFQARAEELSRYSWASDGLLIRPCADEKELILEGKMLHHCVATYAASIAKGGTAILFIRRAEAPDAPYYTLELNEAQMVVRQNRGLRNCDRTPEVQAFEEKWLAWARSQQQKKRKKKEAKAA